MKMKIYKFLMLEIKAKTQTEQDVLEFGICLKCDNFKGEMCVAEELIHFPYKSRKKKCKYFQPLEDFPDALDIEDYYETLDNGI